MLCIAILLLDSVVVVRNLIFLWQSWARYKEIIIEKKNFLKEPGYPNRFFLKFKVM